MNKNPRKRGGTIIIALLVFLSIAMMIVIHWLKLAVIERRQLRVLQARAQAEWLAESALDLAAARLRTNPAYTGETWKLSPAELGGPEDGEVLIRVEPIEGNETQRQVTVRADYPTDPLRRQRRTKSIPFAIQTKGDS